MIEIEDKVNNLPVSILTDSGDSFNYVNANLVERCMLVSNKMSNHRMVQLATGMRRKITLVVKYCKFLMNGLHT